METFRLSQVVLATSLVFNINTTAAQENLEPDNNEIEKITVTGQKIERSLQDTKESVAVFNNRMLEERNLDELSDVYLQTPGVSGDQFGFRIRGVRNSDGSSQPNRGDLASVVVDGVTSSGWVTNEAVGQLWDVAQVEVLRGPQSTNLGRNALAGAIVVNTNDPTYANEGKVRIGFGEYNKSEYKGVANFNLVDGVSAIRFAAETTESDGFIDNITRGEDDYGGYTNTVYRFKWLYEPSDELKLVFSYQHLENEYGNTSTILGEFDREDRIAIADADSVFETDADLISLNLDYMINDSWTLTTITAFQDGERFRFSDADQTAVAVGSGGGTINRNDEDNNWSQELRFNYESDNVRGSSGVFFSEIEANRSQDNIIDYNLPVLFDDFFPGLGTVLTTTAVLPVALYEPLFDTRQIGFTNVDTTTWAVFTQWEVDLNDQWTASFGVRYDNEEQDFSTASNTASEYVLPSLGSPFGEIDLGGLTIDMAIAIINPQLIGLTTAVPETQKTEDFSNILPHAGITYHWNEDLSTSFFVKKSYRSGGSELTLFSGVNDFDAEELWNYESSIRAVMFDGKGILNANIYYSDWTDQQVDVQEPGTTNTAFTITDNAGKSSLYGVEINFAYELTENLDIYAGIAFSKTEFDEFCFIGTASEADLAQFPTCDAGEGRQGLDLSGNNFAFAPEQTGTFGLNYSNPTGFFINANASYTGSSFANEKNDTELEMDSFILLNVNTGYEFDNIKFEAYVRNLTDETYDININIAATDGTPGTRLGAPREIGARVTYSF